MLERGSSERSRQTRKHLIGCFVRLMREMRWDQIEVSRLCTEAKVARGTFYLHFHSIYELMDELETGLLNDIQRRYVTSGEEKAVLYPPEMFDEKFDCRPPKLLTQWFDFCRENREAMAVLLDRKRGDTYFVKKLKHVIRKSVSSMMDSDGMPCDKLRDQFLTVFVEIHFLAATTWLQTKEEDFLPVNEIVHLLNTMRVGANYLSNRRRLEKERQERTGAMVSP